MATSPSSDFPLAVAEAVQASIGTTFASIFGQPPEVNSVPDAGESCARVASVISFFGTQPWALTLVVPEPTAVAMALKFTGFEVPFDSSDMGDVVGELTNVLAGEVVAQLTRRGISSQMSLPTVARGNDVEMLRSNGSSVRTISYNSPQGVFWFDVCTAAEFSRMCRTPGTAA